jgi:molecular chaperone GrpE (heat shock protein)
VTGVGSTEPAENADDARTEEEVVETPETPEEPDVLAAVTKERDDYLDALQRLKAEFDNYRKWVAGGGGGGG